MTLQREDIAVLREVIREVIREELHKIIQDTTPEKKAIGDEEFETAAAHIFRKHKKVLDALA